MRVWREILNVLHYYICITPLGVEPAHKKKVTAICVIKVVVLLLLSANYLPVVINHILMAFYTANNQFACKVFSSGYRVLKNISQLAVVGRLVCYYL